MINIKTNRIKFTKAKSHCTKMNYRNLYKYYTKYCISCIVAISSNNCNFIHMCFTGHIMLQATFPGRDNIPFALLTCNQTLGKISIIKPKSFYFLILIYSKHYKSKLLLHNDDSRVRRVYLHCSKMVRKPFNVGIFYIVLRGVDVYILGALV